MPFAGLFGVSRVLWLAGSSELAHSHCVLCMEVMRAMVWESFKELVRDYLADARGPRV